MVYSLPNTDEHFIVGHLDICSMQAHYENMCATLSHTLSKIDV